MKHIAVNTRLLIGEKMEGIPRFTYEVVSRMARQHPDIRFSFLFDRQYDPRFIPADNVRAVVLPPQARHPLLWHTWFHGMIPLWAKRNEVDLFFSPEFYLPALKRTPMVPVFHDLAYEHFPQYIGKWAANYCRKYSPVYAEKAAHICTVSEFSKEDIIKTYGLAPDKLSVVYNGASATFSPISDAEKKQVRATYTGGAPYFHMVGAIHPRKNITSVLKAFDAFCEQVDLHVKLLLVGRKGWKYEEALSVYEHMKHKESVIFTGFVSDQELGKIYGASEGLVYIPVFEGFGIPLLEAMYAETPIVASEVSSIPEIAGKAAVLVSPTDTHEISRAMISIFQDSARKQACIQEGRKQREKFSWDQTYQLCWKVLETYL
ncbi:MAG: glycosyltransferase family 1 protein [Bacteroidota bacterium]